MSEHTNNSWIQQRYRKLQNKNNVSAQGVRYFLIFMAGILVGWFVLGWWLVPVRYTAVYPNELRPDARSEYFRMVAESYAATQDIGLTAQRLKYWTPEELGPMLHEESIKLETINPAVADRLQQIATLLRLSPEGVVAGQPAAPSSGSGTASLLGTLQVRVGLLIAFLIIVGLLIARALHLPGRLRPDAVAEEPSMSLQDMLDENTTEDAEMSDRPAAPIGEAAPLIVDDEDEEWDEEEYEDLVPFEEADLAVTSPEVADEEPSLPEPDLVSPPPLAPEPEESAGEDEESQAPEPAAPEPEPGPDVLSEPQPPAQPLQLGEDAEHFIFEGDPYYNQIFAIEKEGEYLGEFGMGVGETMADNPNQILTMEVWLFEKRDIRTVTAALMPPQVYGNATLRQELLDGDIIPVALEPGATIHLETEGLEVVGQVRRVEFSPSLEDRPTIRYVELLLVGREKDGVSSVARPSW